MNEAPSDLERQLQHLEAVLGDLEGGTESPLRTKAREVVRAVLDLHAGGLERMMQCIRRFADGPAIVSALTRDPLIAGLLLLHDIHPDDLATRVRAAIDALGAALTPQGARVAGVDVAGGTVRVRLERELGRGGPPAAALRSRVEQAIVAAAPDATGIEVDVPDTAVFVPVAEVRMRRPSNASP
jgi:hypothetical protein